MASEAIWEAHYSQDRAHTFFHSSSYTANPIACAAAAANLAIWREEPVLERVARLSEVQSRLMDRLASVPGVHNARALGTIAACEIDTGEGTYLSDLGPKLLAFFRERDLLLRPLGNTVYVMPPYCIEQAHLERIYETITESAAQFGCL